MKNSREVLLAEVIEGKGRGKKLGFPTANLKLLANQKLPDFGVYAGLAFWKGKKFKAAISCGPAFTFNGTTPTLEAYLLDFQHDLYGEKIELELVSKIREMEKFESQEQLIENIKKDCQRVSEILEHV